MDLEEILCRHFAQFDCADLPDSTLHAVKKLTLDTLGATLAAVPLADSNALIAQASGWGGNEATILGTGARVAAHHAALVNGTLARTLELDDVHERAMLHSTATMLPVAFAAAELAGGVSGRELLTALALGIDLSARISIAVPTDIGSADQPPRTMSFTYATGILVGAMVAARLLGMDHVAMRNVLGVAYSQCAGNQQGLYEKVSTVRLQQGLSGLSAILAVQLSRLGYSGARYSLGGEAGYFKAYHRGFYDRENLLDALGEKFEVDRVSVKPYPTCKYTHTSIAAALTLRNDAGFELADIERVVARVNHREYFEIVCIPESPEERVALLMGDDGRVNAQFSLAYVIACALRDGNVGLEHLEATARHDAALHSLMAKIETVIEDGTSAGRALPVPGIVEIHLVGRDAPLLATVAVAPGHPDNTLSFEQVAAKARLIAGAAIENVITIVRGLETSADCRDLIAASIIDVRSGLPSSHNRFNGRTKVQQGVLP